MQATLVDAFADPFLDPGSSPGASTNRIKTTRLSGAIPQGDGFRLEGRPRMETKSLSPCIITDKIEESKEFDAKAIFDCGWYTVCNCVGLTYNFAVADVDEVHADLIDKGLTPVMPLEDHPWGDRGFAVLDPNGITLYIYSDIEPSDEFKKFHT